MSWSGTYLGWELALLLTPVFVAAHELGHAAVALVRTEGLVEVRVGRGRYWAPRAGRLQLKVSYLPGRGRKGPVGLAVSYARMSRRDRIAFILAGPAAHATAAVAIAALGMALATQALVFAGGVGLLEAVVNLVPFERGPGRRSDGARLLDAIRERPAARRETLSGSSAEPFARSLDETRARWFVLFTDEKLLPRHPGLFAELGGAPVSAGYPPDDRSPSAVALWRLAFAGWCWRRAERGGDGERARTEARKAYDETKGMSHVSDSNRVTLAALSLAARPDLALASPGRTAAERTGFLAAAFRGLPPVARPVGIPEEQQRAAFLYGVALHDVRTAVSDG